MKNYSHLYLITISALFFLAIFVVVGCDAVKCMPQINPNTGYVGFKCGGDW